MTKKISKKAEQARKNLETGLIMMESEARNIEDFLSRMIPFLHNKEFRQKMTQYMYSYVVDKRSQSLRKRYFKDTFSTAPIKSEEKK